MTCCGKKAERTFRPDFVSKPATEKFYARHDRFDSWEGKTKPKNVEYYEEEIERRLKYDPREHLFAPITESQKYGWLNNKAIIYEDEQDKEMFNHPKRSDEISRILKKITYEMCMERQLFAYKK